MKASQPKYNLLCSTPFFKLKSSSDSQALHLKLVAGKKTFAHSLNLKEESKQLAKLFENESNLLEYLKDPKNIRVDGEKGSVIVLGKHPIKKAQTVELYTIEMERAEEEEINQLDQLIAQCEGDSRIEDVVLRDILKQLTNKVQQLQRKTNQDEIHRFANKLENIGNELENLKMKTADLFDTTDQLAQKLQKSNDIHEADLTKIQEKGKGFEDFVSQEINGTENKIRKLCEKLEEQDEMIKGLMAKLKEDVKEAKVEKPKAKSEQMMIKIPSEAETIKYLDRTAKYFHHFTVRGNNITKQQDFIFPTILLGSHPLPPHKKFTLRIKQMGILQQIYPGICIGLVDAQHRNRQSCDNGHNVIQFGCGGKLFESNKYIRTEAKGFASGDFVGVRVDFGRGVIVWEVNGEERCVYKSQLLGKEGIEWRPYAFLRDKGDSIDWISQQ